MSADTIGYQQMPKYNEDGHILCDAITRRYERLWFVVERQLMIKIFKFIAYSDEKGCLAAIISSFCP